MITGNKGIKLVNHEFAGTCCKLTLQLSDGVHIQTVFQYPEWICVSTQAGCELSCRFCESGVQNFGRNLTASEILAQISISEQFGHSLSKHKAFSDEDFTPITGFRSISFSGSGEPLLNLENVADAMHYLYTKCSKITHISTIGIIPRLNELFSLPIPFNLDFSLNATTDDVRAFLIPENYRYPIDQIVRTVLKLNKNRNALLTICYVLLKGLNDSDQDIERLIKLFAGSNAIIELNQYNSICNATFSSADDERLISFRDNLSANNILAYIYKNKGLNINAGYGQLTWRKADIKDSQALYSIKRLPPEPRASKGILLLSLATACGCNCVFCGLPDTKRHTIMERSVLDTAIRGHDSDRPWEEVNITGGDPLIIPEVRKLFTLLALRRQHFSRLSLCTSGIPSKQALKGLKELVELIPDLYLYVSLDGVGELHDRIRGRKGAFIEVERFISEARKLVKTIYFHCVINNLNLSALDELSNYAKSQEIPMIYGVVNQSDHYINNTNRYENICLSEQEVNIAYEFLSRRYPEYEYDDLFRPLRGEKRRIPCRLLTEGVLVTSDGMIAICGTSKQMVLGECSKTVELKSSWNNVLKHRSNLIASGASEVCQKCSYIY